MGEGNILHCVSTAKQLGHFDISLAHQGTDGLVNMVSRVMQTVYHAGPVCPIETTVAGDIKIYHVVTGLQRRRHSAVRYQR